MDTPRDRNFGCACHASIFGVILTRYDRIKTTVTTVTTMAFCSLSWSLSDNNHPLHSTIMIVWVCGCCRSTAGLLHLTWEACLCPQHNLSRGLRRRRTWCLMYIHNKSFMIFEMPSGLFGLYWRCEMVALQFKWLIVEQKPLSVVLRCFLGSDKWWSTEKR